MYEEEYVSISSNISFADASLLSFQFEEKRQRLGICLELWNEECLRLSFEQVLYFEYKSGDFISDIFYAKSESSIMNGSLEREYTQVPENHSYKLIQIKDVNEVIIANIICYEVIF